MNPGKLKHRLTIQNKTTDQDAELNTVEIWHDWKTVWTAPILPTSREFYSYRLATVNIEVTEGFKVRYIQGVTAHQRVLFKGKTLEIIGDPINIDEANKELILSCKEVT